MLSAFVLALLLQTTAPAPEAPLAEPPRYQFEVGQLWSYRYESAFHYMTRGVEGVQHGEGTWELVIVGRTEGGWRAFLVQDIQLSQTQGPDTYTGPRQTEWARFEIDSSGRVTLDLDPMGGLTPRSLLPLLPTPGEDGELPREWVDTAYGMAHRYRRQASEEPELLKIEERIDGLMQRVLEKQVTHRFSFDRSQGRMTRMEGEIASLWGSTLGNGTLSLTLQDVKTLESEALQVRDRDSKEYTSVVVQLRAAIRAATYGAKGWEETMAAAQKRIATAAESMSDARLKKKLAELVRVFEYQVRISPQRWSDRKARLGQPGPQWTRKEFTGRERSAADTLGQITVLSFWNRPNSWSMRILPEIPRLMERYSGKPVTFLGMNNDRVRADAEFVLGMIDLPIPTVEAAGLSEQYGIRAFPAVVIVAPDGTIHDYHEGYNPLLLADITRNIDDLLREMESAEKAGDSTGGN